jgi:hypothetical protein
MNFKVVWLDGWRGTRSLVDSLSVIRDWSSVSHGPVTLECVVMVLLEVEVEICNGNESETTMSPCFLFDCSATVTSRLGCITHLWLETNHKCELHGFERPTFFQRSTALLLNLCSYSTAPVGSYKQSSCLYCGLVEDCLKLKLKSATQHSWPLNEIETTVAPSTAQYNCDLKQTQSARELWF